MELETCRAYIDVFTTALTDRFMLIALGEKIKLPWIVKLDVSTELPVLYCLTYAADDES